MARKGKRGDDGKKKLKPLPEYGKKREKRRIRQEKGKEESMARKGKRGDDGKKKGKRGEYG